MDHRIDPRRPNAIRDGPEQRTRGSEKSPPVRLEYFRVMSLWHAAVGPHRRWTALVGLLAVVALTARVIANDSTASGAPAAHQRAISIVWGGDVALDAARALPSDGQAGLSAIAAPLAGTDLALVNLEGALGVSGTAKCGGASPGTCFAFQAPPKIARELAYAGIDAVNLANNHSFDAGPAGLSATTAALDGAEMGWAGPPGSIRVMHPAGAPVALIGLAPYRWANDLRDLAVVRAQVQAATRRAEIVVVMMHAGREGQDASTTPMGREVAFGEDRGDTRAAAHAAIDAGADLVLGSGPHVVRGIERYRNRLVVYSTGNLAGNDTLSLSGLYAQAALVRVRLRPDGTPVTGRVVSLALAPPGTPSVDPGRAAAHTIDAAGARDFGPGAVRVREDGILSLSAASE